jgi:hypothetical protein
MMELSDFYPAAADLVKSELSVLGYLRDNPYIKGDQPQVARAAADYYQRNRGSRSGFEFQSFFDICHASVGGHQAGTYVGARRPANIRLTLSGRIDVMKRQVADVSYCLSVCRLRYTGCTARLTILRKFHFDAIAGSRTAGTRLQQHPLCHLQYCGEMLPFMATLGCRDTQLEQMHPWLSEPRILFWPMSLALLIDMALHEFPDQRSAKFRADNSWRGLVHSQEDLLVRPFCLECVDVIVNGGGGRLTLADAFYVR